MRKEVTQTAKYKKAHAEYTRMLATSLKEAGYKLKDYESYSEVVPEIIRSYGLNKNVIAKKHGITSQCLQNWINRHSWNDLTSYIDVPEILQAKSEEGKRSNTYYGADMLKELKMHASKLTLTGEVKYSNKELAEELKISESTFYKYLKKPEFNEVFELARKQALRKYKYEAALDKKAFGQTIRKHKTEDHYFKNAYVGKKNTEITEEQAGDTKAIVFGLTNLMPENYSNKTEVKQKVDVDAKIDLKNLSDAELERILNG